MTETLLLVVFGAVVLLAAAVALRARPPRVVGVLQQTVHTTGQAAVRLSVLILATLVFLAIEVGFDFVLGAFAGGLVVGLALDSPDAAPVRMRLEGVGFGFLIPIYFVVTGMNFDLDSLLTPTGLGLAALFLALFLVVRGASALLWLRELGPRPTAEPRDLQRDRPAADRRHRGDRHGSRRDRRRRRHVVDRRRDDLRARVPTHRDRGREPRRANHTDRLRRSPRYVNTFTARATTRPRIASETKACTAIAILAHGTSGMTSVGLNAVALVKPRYR